MGISYVYYDDEVDALRITTDAFRIAADKDEGTSPPLWYNDDIVVDLATEDGHDIVGLGILCASLYLPLGKKGYDAETDTLLMGDSTSDPALITENGDFIGYWKVDEDYSDGFLYPIGVVVKRASVHLTDVMAAPSGV